MFPCQLFAFAYGWKISRNASLSPRPTLPHWLLPWQTPCSFFTFPFTLFIFQFHGGSPTRPFPPSLLCVLSTDNWRRALPAPCGRNQSRNAAATAARHFNGTFRFSSVRFGAGRVCRRRLPPLVGATSTCIFAVAELLLPASCVVAQCVAQVFASTEHKTKTRLESVSKLHREHSSSRGSSSTSRGASTHAVAAGRRGVAVEAAKFRDESGNIVEGLSHIFMYNLRTYPKLRHTSIICGFPGNMRALRVSRDTSDTRVFTAVLGWVN